MKKIVLYPFFLMLLAGIMLPSDGGRGLLNPKSLGFLFTAFGLSCYIFVKKTFNATQLKSLMFLMFSLTFLILWALIGIISEKIPISSTLDQFKMFLLTICVVVFTFFIIQEKILTFERFLKILIYANLAYSILKSSLIVLHMLGVINIFTIMAMTGLRFMSMDMGTGMVRMQTSVDMITPFLLFFVLQSQFFNLNFGRLFRTFYIIFSVFSIFLSFSRVLMMIGFLSAGFFWFTLSANKLVRSSLLCIFITCAILPVVGVDKISAMVQQRLFSDSNYKSDKDRTDQIAALMKEYNTAPFFGKGLGGYSEDEVRDDMILHSYETQWVAFLMQFGLFGLFLILSSLSLIVGQYFSVSVSRMNIALLGLFGCWLLSGFTNPYLISLTSGIIYALFLQAAIYMKTFYQFNTEARRHREDNNNRVEVGTLPTPLVKPDMRISRIRLPYKLSP